MLFNMIRGNIRRKFCLLTAAVVLVYVVYLLMTLSRHTGGESQGGESHGGESRGGGEGRGGAEQQQPLLLKHLQQRHQTETEKPAEQAIAKNAEIRLAEINIQPQDNKNADDKDHNVKAPDGENDAQIAKIGQQNPQVKDATWEKTDQQVEIHSINDDPNNRAHSADDNNDVYFKAYTGPYDGPQNSEQKAIVEAFQFAWSNYREHAWGQDELKPVSGRGSDWFGVGLTIVDSLDTLYIMGLKKEFAEARDWVAHHLTFNSTMPVSLFEIVIRELGGLLSAYHLSKDPVFLQKAEQLAEKLRPCMTRSTHIPCMSVNLHTTEATFDRTNLASVGSVQLEFRALARATNKRPWEETVDSLNTVLHNLEGIDGLHSTSITPAAPHSYRGSSLSVGAEGDSFYEYLLKQWLQTGKTKPIFKDDFIEAMEGVKKHLVRRSRGSDLTFVGKYVSIDMGRFVSEMEHLTCFLPGVLALAYMHGLGNSYLVLAESIGETCYEMYQQSPTGLSPEVVSFNGAPAHNKGMYVNMETSYSLLRPETVESLFYLYRATKDRKYQQWGWQIYEAIEKHARVKHGYSSIQNVQRIGTLLYMDKMETFFLTETLKYLYLLFSDDPNLLPLDKFVFNTEAHPLPIYES